MVASKGPKLYHVSLTQLSKRLAFSVNLVLLLNLIMSSFAQKVAEESGAASPAPALGSWPPLATTVAGRPSGTLMVLSEPLVATPEPVSPSWIHLMVSPLRTSGLGSTKMLSSALKSLLPLA